MSEATSMRRRVAVKRLLRLAIAEWLDGQQLYDTAGQPVGQVETRGEPGDGAVMVLMGDGTSFGFFVRVE